MKISLNWLKQYVEIPTEISDEELIRLIGARLVEVEGVIDESHKYDNIVVVRVEKAEKIPDTHLTLCQVNDGGEELVQVVCGAPNVREGMLAAWIKPGAVVPASVHEDAPFVIGKRRMLGKFDSNGMLAGADELDFGGKHDKIAEIDPELANPGDELADVFELNDLILEIENKSLTHRPDTFGIIGFAREVAGILGVKFHEPDFMANENSAASFIDALKDIPENDETKVSVEISDAVICPRYTLAVLKVSDATAEDKYLTSTKILLAKAGMQSVSRIVDVTNYMMLLTGQPLHAFDYDKFVKVGGANSPKVIVRTASEGEKIVLLDGTEVKCVPSDILITSNNVPVAMAGAMGGANTEIDENTNNVLLESATFSLYNLRKTQMEHGIFSEAITRFTKGVPMGGTLNVLAEAVRDLHAKAVGFCDYKVIIQEPIVVKITTDEINRLLGTNYSVEQIVQTLSNVSFIVKDNSGHLEITAPYWRTDIHIPEDIIEEVGRLLGYESIAPTLPLHATANRNEILAAKNDVRDLLSRFGANEVLTYSFVSKRIFDNSYQDAKNAYRIVNSISPDLQFVRQSLIPSLLEKAYLNVKLPVDQFAIYEINKVYQKSWGMTNENVPTEKYSLGLLIAERKNHETAFYKAKKYADAVLKAFGIEVEYLPLKDNSADCRPFEPKRSAEIHLKAGGGRIGVVGEFKKSVQANFKLPEYLAGFELDFDLILRNRSHVVYTGLSKVEERDLTVTTDLSYAELTNKIQAILDKFGAVAEITPGLIYLPEGNETKHITVHLKFTQFEEAAMQELEKL